MCAGVVSRCLPEAEEDRRRGLAFIEDDSVPADVMERGALRLEIGREGVVCGHDHVRVRDGLGVFRPLRSVVSDYLYPIFQVPVRINQLTGSQHMLRSK